MLPKIVLLILEIAAGILLALVIRQLPTIYRRRKLRDIFLRLSPVDVLLHASQNNMYTKDQQDLLIQLSMADTREKRQRIVTQLVHSFPEK